jgi:hypothetical protein
MENLLNWTIAWVIIVNLLTIVALVRIGHLKKQSDSTLLEIRELKAFIQGSQRAS